MQWCLADGADHCHPANSVFVMDGVTVKKRIVAGFAWTAGTKLFVQIISWASTIVVARILLPADYGILAVAASVTGFLDMVMELGLAQGLIHESKTTRAQEDSVFYISLLLGLIVYLAVYFSAPALAGFYEMPLLRDILPVLGISLILSSLKVVPSALAMQRLDFRYRALVEMAATFLSSLSVVVLAILGFGAWSIAIGLIMIQLVSALGYLPLFDHVPRPVFAFQELRHILRFGVSTMTSRLMFFFYSRTDVLVAGRFVGQNALGFYTMAYTLAELPLEKIGTVFHKVAFPAIAHVKGDTGKARSYFLGMHRYLLIISYPLLIGIALVSEDVVTLLLTTKWLAIVPFLQIFCLVNLIKVSGMLMSPVLLGRGSTGVIFRYNAASAVAILVAVLVGIQFGLMGMVYAVGIINVPLYLYLANALMHELQLQRSEFIASFASPVIASIGLAIAVLATQAMLVPEPGVERLAASVLAGAVSYVGVFFVFYRGQLHQAWEDMRLLSRKPANVGTAVP